MGYGNAVIVDIKGRTPTVTISNGLEGVIGVATASAPSGKPNGGASRAPSCGGPAPANLTYRAAAQRLARNAAPSASQCVQGSHAPAKELAVCV